MASTIRLYMLVEAATFTVAAAIHGGVLVSGYEHREARIAETAIVLALLGGVALSWTGPALTRTAGLAAQGFALFWTLVGIGTIIAGIGPRTVPDVAYHVAVVGLLVRGLVVAHGLRIRQV